ncbi:amino acid adenylation domain-containing protein, partial [Noviherbaspirillum sp. Root189]|uniref:acyl carrier protein n=1 Tax=Noviherbaspirillum sp. Root189 TaxID=1736487 RepID=UPI003FA600D4
MGGHSLLAVTLIERMRREDLHTDVRALFDAPTLTALAQAVGGTHTLVTVPENRIAPGCASITPDMLPLVDLSQGDIDRIVQTVPGGVANIQDIYPLAPLQEGILFHHLMTKEGDPYLLAGSYGFDSRKRLDAFLQALQSVVDRHDILRTAFLWQGLPEPVQVVWRHAPVVIEEVTIAPANGDVLAQLETLADPQHRRLDVRKAPLMHVYIAHDTGNDRWLLRLLSHHLWGDHTTLDVVMEEMQAFLAGGWDALPAPLPFRNFIAQTRLGISRQEHEDFFRDMLNGFDTPTIPFGLSDARRDGVATHEAKAVVDPALAARVRRRARAQGVSAASIFHLAWARVLAEVSNQDDVVFGTVLFGRMQGGAGADRVVGLFMNTLPLRLRASGMGVQTGVKNIHAALSRLLRHEHAPLALAQRCSAIAAPAPLFSAVLNYRHSNVAVPADDGTLQAWEGIQSLGNHERTSYPFTLSVDDDGEDFFLTAQTEAPADPERVCAYVQVVLAGMMDALERRPDLPVEQLDLLTPQERHQLQVDWSGGEVTYPADQCVHTLFELHAALAPDTTALVHEGVTLTYGELNARANRFARHLRKIGVGFDARVALCMERGIDMVVGAMAVLKAGGGYVPLDPAYPAERLAFMIEDSTPVAVLTHASVGGPLRAMLNASPAPLLDLDTQSAYWAGEDDGNLDVATLGLAPHHLAYVIYTSGSTGKPKGVMVEHRHLCSQVTALSRHCTLGPQERMLQFASMNFDVSVEEIFCALSSGATLVLRTPAWVGSARTFWSLCREHDVSWVNLPTRYWEQLVQEDLSDIPACLRQMIVGGEEMGSVALGRWLAHQGHKPRLINAYGPTETTVNAALHDPQAGAANGRIIGRPMANARIYLLDRNRKPVPQGVQAELYIGGAGVARGYLNRDELTQERFLPDPFSSEPGARMYRSGDLGRYLPDGNIEFLGRNDQQVKLRGFRIELGEIEAKLLEQDGVREAVVLAREDRPGDMRLVAYVTKTEEAQLDSEALRVSLQAMLPEYMVPAAYVVLDTLPLTPNGKLDRQALPAPEGDAYAVRPYEAPQGEVEIALATIWAEVLAVEQISRHDNFFTLGGHSLLAVKVASRVRQVLGVELGVTELFTHTSLSALATAVGQAAHAQSELPAITLASRESPLPLSFAQQRLWFLSQMEGVSQAYHIPLGLRMQGTLDRNALQQALDRIVARHEALRTTFVLEQGQPVQRIAADTGFILQEHDLRNQNDAEAKLDELADAEAAAPFDLATGPLVRGQLIRLADDEHVLLVTMHHIVSDGWSQGILVNEFSALYNAYCEG